MSASAAVLAASLVTEGVLASDFLSFGTVDGCALGPSRTDDGMQSLILFLKWKAHCKTIVRLTRELICLVGTRIKLLFHFSGSCLTRNIFV